MATQGLWGQTHPVLPLLHLVFLASPSLLQECDLGSVLCQLGRLEERVESLLGSFWQSPSVNQHSPTGMNGLPGDGLRPLLHGQETLPAPP